MTQSAPKKVVLAYSGGLDTSVILPWLKKRYPGVKLVAFAAELGQGDELKSIEEKAYKSGADEVIGRAPPAALPESCALSSPRPPSSSSPSPLR